MSLQVPCMACTNRSEILLVLNSSALPLTAHMRSWTNAIAVLLRRVTEAYNSDASLRAEWSSLLCNRLFATPSRPKWGCGESAFDQKGPITPSDVRLPAIGRVALRTMEPYKIVYSGREDISRAMAAIKRARSDGYLMVRHRGPKAGLGSPCSVLMVWGHQAISTEENAELLVSHAGEWLQSRKAAYTKGSAMAARLSAEFGIEVHRIPHSDCSLRTSRVLPILCVAGPTLVTLVQPPDRSVACPRGCKAALLPRLPLQCRCVDA